jgi:hypothetical protein
MRAKLFLALILIISGCLGRATPENPEPKKLSIEKVDVKSNALDIAYTGKSHQPTSEGFYEEGFLRVINKGGSTLRGINLKINGKTTLSAAEIDIIKHTPGRQVKEKDIRLIQNVTIKPTAIFIEELKHGEAKEFPIAFTVRGEGNYYGIEVLYENRSIWGMQGFLKY